jgi:hypothetical protein
MLISSKALVHWSFITTGTELFTNEQLTIEPMNFVIK